MSEPKDDDLSFLAEVVVPDLEEPTIEFPDTFPAALRFAFVGVGHAGCRFADTAYGLGWRKVVAINTSSEDLRDLKALPDDRRFLFGGSGGAGKDPRKGHEQIAAAAGDILDLLVRKLGRDVEHVIVVLGAGGGTGSGAVHTGTQKNLLDIVNEYAAQVAPAAPSGEPLVGVLCTLPDPTEGARVFRNAHEVLTTLFQAVEDSAISPLIVVDNARILNLWPKITAGEMYQRSNALVLNTLQAFLSFAVREGTITFDREDLRSVLRSGAITFGMTNVTDPASGGLSAAVRKNAVRGLLAEGFDFTKARIGAMLVAGQPWDQVAKQDFDDATSAFSAMIGNGTIHRGLFRGPFERLRVYSMIGGLPRPEGRLAELARKAG